VSYLAGGDASGDPHRFFRGLKDKDLRREGVVIAEGRLVAARAAARLPLLAVLAEPSAAEEAEKLAVGRCPVTVLSVQEIERIAGYPFHRGLLVAAERPRMPDFQLSVVEGYRRLLVLPNPTDPENLGAIVRSAAALGWDACLLGIGACDPYGRRALRCSMGATLTLPLFSAEPEDLEKLTGAGWVVLAAELAADALVAGTRKAEVVLHAERLVLIFGNEHDGIPITWRTGRPASVAIPQGRSSADGVDSLNVAAAAAILLWEAR